jgi:serpin B
MPKFEVAFDAINGDSKALIDALKAMGIESAFIAQAEHLDNMIVPPPDEAAYVSDVKQKTYLKVDEAGAEAAAASMVEISIMIDGGGTPVRTVTVDRPFLFAIQDRCTGTVLFLGHITNPPPVDGTVLGPPITEK